MNEKLCLALIALALAGCGDRPSAGTAAAPAAEASTCASAAPVRLDDAKVPPQFKDLIPLARKWGVGDDADRSACIAAASAAERDAFEATLAGRTADIHRWLDEVKPGQALS